LTEKAECAEPVNVEVGCKKYAVVDPDNPCLPMLAVFYKHAGREVVSPKEYEAIKLHAEGKVTTPDKS